MEVDIGALEQHGGNVLQEREAGPSNPNLVVE
jgi:hypothetical protein